MFDPRKMLFPRGAHMPLLVFLGIRPRRSPEAIQRREINARRRQIHNRATAFVRSPNLVAR